MTPKEYQVQLLDVMENWRDEALAPDSPDQPIRFKEMRDEYLKVNSRQKTPMMDSQVDINTARAETEANRRAAMEPGMWTDVKNLTSDALQRGAQVSSGIPGAGFALRQLANIDRANMGDAISASFQSYLGDPDVEESLAGVVRGDQGAQAGYDELLPGFQETREASKALTDPGVANIMRSFGKEGLGTGLKSLWDDPVASYNLVGTTLGRSPASVALGAGGTAAGALAGFGIGGPPGATLGGMAGGAAGGGAGGWMDERTGGIIRMLEEKGFDIANPAHIQLLKENQEVFNLASDQADKRALAIGAFSAISGAVSAGLGRVAAGPAISALGKFAVPARFGAAGGSIPISGLLESGGEYTAQQAAGQPTNWADVKLEGVLGSLIDAPITATGMASAKFAPHAGVVNNRTRSLAEKEANIIASAMPFGGMVNIVQGEVSVEGSAELVPDVDGRGEQLNINIDNLINRSDGTRSGIRAQLMEDIAHELGGHKWVQDMLINNEDFVQEAFKANEDLILAWQKKSAYQDLGRTNDDILYEEWVAQFGEMDTRILRRIELMIVNYLHKLIGKSATAKLIKSWDARNISMRNIAKDYLSQIKKRGKAGEVQPVQTITAEESEVMPRPEGPGVTYGDIGATPETAQQADPIAALEAEIAAMKKMYVEAKKTGNAEEAARLEDQLGPLEKQLQKDKILRGDFGEQSARDQRAADAKKRHRAIKEEARDIDDANGNHDAEMDLEDGNNAEYESAKLEEAQIELDDLTRIAEERGVDPTGITEYKYWARKVNEAKANLKRLDARAGRAREGRGKLESPSRRKFLKQAAGTAAVAAVDPSILLEPATTPAVEAPMYTGMTEQFPGSIYEFSIATDPDAGWTSADDPGEGDIDVSFTHDPNTNEVTVYEDHKVVDTFEVDDMHADAEVLDYVRDQYGPESINDVRVQREEMDRDPFTGEGEADYWGDADERFDDMAMDLIRGEKTMAGVE